MPDRRALLLDWQEFLIAESHVLSEYPDLLWQQAANQPAHSAPAQQAAAVIGRARAPSRPWLRQTNRSARRPRMVLVGHRSATRAQPSLACTVWGLGLTDNRLLVSGGGDGMIRMTELDGGREVTRWKAHEQVRALAVSGSRIVSGGGHTVRFWEIGRDAPIATHEADGFVRAISISPDGDWALIGGDGFLWLWNVEADKRVDLSRHLPKPFYIDAVAFLGSSRSFAFGSSDEVAIMNLGGKAWRVPAHDPRGLAFLEARRWVVYLDPHRRAWSAFDTVRGTFAHHLIQGHSEKLTAIAVTPDGARVITGSRDASIWVWDAESAEPLGSISGHGWDVTALLALPDGLLASGSEDGTIRMWDLDALEPVSASAWAKRRHVHRVSFTLEGTVLAWRKGDMVYELDAATGRTLRTASERGLADEEANRGDPGLDGGFMASIRDRVLTVRDVSGTAVCRYVGPNELTSLASSGKRIAIGDRGGITVLLELVLPPRSASAQPHL